MKALLTFEIILVILFLPLKGNALDLNDTFQGITTLVIGVTPKVTAQGTGFFYHQLGSEDPKKKGQPQWRAIENVWLVTNRHIMLPKIQQKETVPTNFVFHMRQVIDGKLKWDPISLGTQELVKRAKCHSNPTVDICVITILDLLTAKLKGETKYLQWVSVGKEDFPAGTNKISVEASDDVIVVGYPRSFYDQVSLFPIIKAGIIASRWGANFNGNPYFLIDAKLFPGSSGSVVVSKPIDMVVSGGKIFTSKEKQYAFLGIYSGEPFLQEQPVELDDIVILRKVGFNLGIVWYGYLVEEIIASGLMPQP